MYSSVYTVGSKSILQMFFGLFTGNFFSYAVIVFIYVCYWFIMKKTGDEGWKGVIPMYNEMKIFEKAGKRNLFWGYIAGLVVYAMGFMLVGFSAVGDFITLSASAVRAFAHLGGQTKTLLIALLLGGIFVILGLAAIIVFHIMRCIGLAKNFGCAKGWVYGLIFLYPVFLGLLAFNKSIHYTIGDPQGPYMSPIQTMNN